MGPPAEQLISEYLARLADVARATLLPDDRRALLTRTGALIERQSGAASTADAAEVKRILSGLGDPDAVVERERARLAALRSAETDGSARPDGGARPDGSAAGSAGPAMKPRPVAGTGPLAGRQPQHEITPAKLPTTSRRRPGAAMRPGQRRPHRFSRSRASSERTSVGDSAAAPAAQPGSSAPADETLATRGLRRPRRLQPGDLSRQIARRAAGAGRQHRLETVSVALLAAGALIYPVPGWLAGFLVWLLGAVIAAPSRLWSLPDKWLGLIGPVGLVIIGTAAAVSLGGTRSTMHAYLHEALADCTVLFKIGSLLGAGYLAWRIHRGRRVPAVPPWLRRRA